MQLTKKELKKIISEEIDNITNEKDELETLIEGYSAGYEEDSDYVSKDAIIDFLEVMNENRVPKIAFEAFMKNLSEDSISPILKEVLEG